MHYNDYIYHGVRWEVRDMKRALVVLFVLALLPGCSSLVQHQDQPPNAYIDAITPGQVHVGDAVNFSGHGTDADGQVVGYSWRSDIDGQLSTMSVFETSSLSVGDHEIFFMVQDNNGEWSAEVTGYVTVLAGAVASVNVDSFTASPLTIAHGGSVTLSWSVSNATAVSIDQGVGTVAAVGSTTVAPGSTTTYTLTATGTRSTASAAVTVAVGSSPGRFVLTADPDNSGYVRSSGANSLGYIYVGDDQYNRDFQGFVTFDISSLPDNAVIARAMVDFSGYEIPDESPYPEMGCLDAYLQDYGSLGSGDYFSRTVAVSIGHWCSLDELNAIVDQPGFRNELQRRTRENQNVFQFRLQFADRLTDGDDQNDLLLWSPGHLPRLIIEYSL